MMSLLATEGSVAISFNALTEIASSLLLLAMTICDMRQSELFTKTTKEIPSMTTTVDNKRRRRKLAIKASQISG